jgi:DNA modification methylase
MSGAAAFVVQGDCLDVLKTFPDCSISAVVTDPPYGLSKEPDMIEVLRHWLATQLAEHVYHAAIRVGVDQRLAWAIACEAFGQEAYKHTGGGFMGKSWDSFVPGPEVWREVLRVLKPGGHALVFSGTRTYDLAVLAMRIAGFEIRDQLAWLYGTGFPKSLDVSKAIDASLGAVREIIGQRRGQGSIPNDRGEWGLKPNTPVDITTPGSPEAAAWDGWGTALKPAQEPIVLARKPLCGTVAANVLQHGTGGLNIEGCRIEAIGRPHIEKTGRTWEGSSMPACESRSIGTTDVGRWPANVLLDEQAAEILDEQSGYQKSGTTVRRNGPISGGVTSINRPKPQGPDVPAREEGGGASRFFYVAKASRQEREQGLDHLPAVAAEVDTGRAEDSAGAKHARAGRHGARRNHHPTVKPIALMRHLIRLITPPGGMVLDPFGGSGTTPCAAVLEGVASVTIELTPEYIPIIEGRIAAARKATP